MYYYPHGSLNVDMEAKQNLLKNIPEVARNYDVVSKIGEGTILLAN